MENLKQYYETLYPTIKRQKIMTIAINSTLINPKSTPIDITANIFLIFVEGFASACLL